MHEMGIMHDVLATCEDIAKEAGKTRITTIALTIGELTDIQDFALDFAFEALSPATMAAGATLDVTYLGATSRCRACGKVYQHDRFEMLCPDCGSFNIEPLSGRELQIDTIEADCGPGTDDDDEAVSPTGSNEGEQAAGIGSDEPCESEETEPEETTA